MSKKDDGEVLNLYKPAGYTPLQAIEDLKKKLPKYKNKKTSYAGKLDPMAEGVLLVLVGEKLKDQKRYQTLDKEYVADILFGFSTDTYDVLGLVENSGNGDSIDRPQVESEIISWAGSHKVELPAFCSYEIEGKPLFKWAREGRLDEIDIPKKDMNIKKASLLDYFGRRSEDVLSDIKNKIKEVEGDFRQDEILNRWQEFLSKRNEKYQIARVKFQCSSGTYIRSLVHEIGKDMDVPAVLFNLTRTKIGNMDRSSESGEVFWAGDSIRLERL